MNADQVRFIVVTHNNQETISRCLRCILEQGVSPVKITVIDNNGSDECAELVRSDFPGVHLVPLKENIGFAAANNLGIEMAEEESFIAMINPDAFLDENWLQEMFSATDRYPNAASFASLQLSDDRKWIDGFGDVQHVSGNVWRQYEGDLLEKHKSLKDREVFSACAAAALYRKDALLEAGCLEESYFCYVEDVDLGYKLQLLGYTCMAIPSARAIHLGFSSTGPHSEFALYHGHRNQVFSFFKNTPLLLLILTLPIHFFDLMITFVGFSNIGHQKVLWRSKIDAYKNLKPYIEMRKSLHAMRRVSSWQIARKLNWVPLLMKKIKVFLRLRMKKRKDE